MCLKNNISEQQNEIKALLNDFYYFLECENPRMVYAMLSPNLQQISLMKKHIDKYSRLLIFRRKVMSITLFNLTTIKEDLLEGIVMLSLLPVEADAQTKKNGYTPDDLRYRAVKIRFININNDWFIDEISFYQEFWEKEFKEYAGKLN